MRAYRTNVLRSMQNAYRISMDFPSNSFCLSIDNLEKIGEGIQALVKQSWEPKGTPPMPPPPPRSKALLRDYQPLVSLNKALLGPYFLGGSP